jgi:hypothetical protein
MKIRVKYFNIWPPENPSDDELRVTLKLEDNNYLVKSNN